MPHITLHFPPLSLFSSTITPTHKMSADYPSSSFVSPNAHAEPPLTPYPPLTPLTPINSQPLHRQRTADHLSPGPSCPKRTRRTTISSDVDSVVSSCDHGVGGLDDDLSRPKSAHVHQGSMNKCVCVKA